MVRITPIYPQAMKRPFGRGPTTRSLGDFRSPLLLTTCESWDDHPSIKAFHQPFHLLVYWWSSSASIIGNFRQDHDWWKNSGQFSSSKSSSAFAWPPFIQLILSALHQVAVEFLRFKGGFKRYQHLGPPAMASQSKLWISMNQILRSRFNLKCIQKKETWHVMTWTNSWTW